MGIIYLSLYLSIYLSSIYLTGNRIKSREINPYMYHKLIYNGEAMTTWWRKSSLFNKWCLDNWIFTSKGMNLNLYLTSYTKQLLILHDEI